MVLNSTFFLRMREICTWIPGTSKRTGSVERNRAGQDHVQYISSCNGRVFFTPTSAHCNSLTLIFEISHLVPELVGRFRFAESADRRGREFNVERMSHPIEFL
jgi:hypothetical protein